VHVSDLLRAALASQEIMAQGAGAVVVKGGHLDCTDLLRVGADVHLLPGKRIAGGNHGVGCTYSAALTSFLALGCSLPEAARNAKEFAAQSVAHSINVGRGAGPVNQAAGLRAEAERFRVLCNVQSAVEMLLDEPKLAGVIPSGGSSIGMAVAGAVALQDVAGIEGMLVRAGRRALLCGCVKLGADGAAARTILKAMSFAPQLRAAMNLSPEALPGCQALGLHTVQFEQQREACCKDADGDFMGGMGGRALQASDGSGLGSSSLPDVILEQSAAGRERTIWLLGAEATRVAARAVELARLVRDGKI
jgi:predicted fused transcriptional regulator/phosphomethylpyrimidine kinase